MLSLTIVTSLYVWRELLIEVFHSVPSMARDAFFPAMSVVAVKFADISLHLERHEQLILKSLTQQVPCETGSKSLSDNLHAGMRHT
jgi:hypothetical protein